MRALSITLLLALSFTAFGQGRYDANWCFGHNAGINFTDTSNPTAFLSVCNNIEACASISDSEGNLLFYLTSGPNDEFDTSTVRNISNNIISNGDTILINPNATNGCMILPFKGGYYIFQIYSPSASNINYNFLFSKVNDTLGTLKVTKKNLLLSNELVEEKLAAVRHANGRDWWVILHQTTTGVLNNCSDTFFIYLATSDTIYGPKIQSIGSSTCGGRDYPGQMLFSEDGTQLIETLWNDQKIDIFSFDRCAGVLSDWHSLQMPNGIQPYGCAL